MQRLATLTAALILAWWIPATSYCLMENAGLVQAGLCCGDTSSDNCDDTCTIGCGIIESAAAKISAHATELPTPVLNLIGPVAVPPAAEAHTSVWTQWLPPDERLAEFLARTVFPARAPSAIA